MTDGGDHTTEFEDVLTNPNPRNDLQIARTVVMNDPQRYMVQDLAKEIKGYDKVGVPYIATAFSKTGLSLGGRTACMEVEEWPFCIRRPAMQGGRNHNCV